MTIVTSTVEITFTSATVAQSVTRDLGDGDLPHRLWSLVLDLPDLVSQFGSIEQITLTADVVGPTVVALPGTLGTLASALAVVAFLVMRARPDESGPPASRKPRGHRAA